jgi:glutamate-ammonia-ligase adenylyltransferase
MKNTEPTLPTLLDDDADRLAARFAEACAAAAVPLTDVAIAATRKPFALSKFIAETAIAQPVWFVRTVLAGDIEPREMPSFEREIAQALDGVDEARLAFAELRRLRNRELARIAWRDIVHSPPVESVIAELSDFADACITASLGWATAGLGPRFGTPRDANGNEIAMVVIAMGKLGGRELNFSSDIDLIFAYPAAGSTAGGRRDISNQEYFDKLGRQFIAMLNEASADGFVFRVDMRLRPFGDSGPLTSSFDALEHYYQLHGRDWERYAFIKARMVTGPDYARTNLESILRPFVYRRYLDYGALESVREMKALIDEEVRRRDLARDVKLGAGGIREIEFIGQTFQLIRGGREPLLQRRGILDILGNCAELRLLEPVDTDALAAAYRFLRRTEHRLQQFADRQTQELPRDLVGEARLACGMGFADYPAFCTELEQHRAHVRRCFRELLSPEGEVEPAPELRSNLDAAAALWQGTDADDATFAALGFGDPAAASQVLERLRAPAFLDRLSREGRERLDRLMPRLIEASASRYHTAETFARLAELVRAIARRSVYLSLLTDHPATLARLIDLFHASPWIARQITAQPLLLDELLDTRVLYAPPAPEVLVEQLGTLLAAHDPDDLEALMDTLRQFKNQQVLRVAASDVMEQFPIAEVSNQLSYIAQALLHHALAMARSIVETKHGVPTCIEDGERRPVGYAIVGYGKLGGLELGYGSDLDLVFLHDSTGEKQVTGGERPVDNNVYFTRLTQRIIHFLGTLTAAGRAYEVDTRLRPSGDSGLLVSSVQAFSMYQRERAWTWEHQALIRARAVAGDSHTMAAFETVRREILGRARDPDKLRADILEMRDRIRHEHDRSDTLYFDVKQGLGGITDIEFMVQYGVLRWAHQHNELLEFSDNLRLLERLTGLGLMPAPMGTVLHDAYFALRAAVHRSALQEIEGLVEDTKFRQHRDAVATAWREWFATP